MKYSFDIILGYPNFVFDIRYNGKNSLFEFIIRYILFRMVIEYCEDIRVVELVS